jgi:hypothetical protein
MIGAGAVPVIGTISVGIEVVRAAVVLSGVAVGGLVVYQALRGYRRNDSRPMLFLGLGLLLLGPVHFLLLAVPSLGPFSVGLAQQLLDVLGLVLVLYSLTRA